MSLRVDLVAHPRFATTTLTADQALLDTMAATYAATLPIPANIEVERFLFGYVPIAVFDRIFDGEADIAGLLWLMHLSGYFGGRWLRNEIAIAQPDAPLVGFSVAPTEAGFLTAMAEAQRNLDAARDSDDAALAHARESLFDRPPADEGALPSPGLTDNFGYNLGYMLEILESPPEGLSAAPEYDVAASPGVLGCRYASPRLAVLARLADIEAAIASGQEPYTELAAELQPIQDAAVPRGRSVWSSGLSVQGFPQKAYDQLLDVSSSFLETVQATALMMAGAAVTGDVTKARVGARANAAMVVWLSSYRDGLLDGETEVQLPAIVGV